MTHPKGYVDSEYLRIAGESVKHLKRRTYELLQLRPGQAVLDVGCGPATDTIDLGRLVGHQGHVYGVDHDQAMIDEANSRSREAGLAAWVEHRRADSGALPFADDTFDAVRSERLFQHLPDPAPTMREMVRVTRGGGLLAVLDTDWGSASTDTTLVDIERRLVRAHAEHAAHNGYAGRQLYRLFVQHGLADVRIELHPNWSTNYSFYRRVTLQEDVERVALAEGLVTADEVQRLRTELEKLDAQGAFFSCANQVLVVGRKP